MNYGARKPISKKILLVVLPVMNVTIAESRQSSGVFAVVRRQDDFVESIYTRSPFRRNRRRGNQDCDHLTEIEGSDNNDYNHEMIIPSDDRNFHTFTPEGSGRFALEYEMEREMIRSAENPYIQRSIYSDNTDETKNNNAHRIINPAAWFRSDPTESETSQWRQAFDYGDSDSIFV